MENVSKALIMAGGILIGLIVFAIFVYEMTYFASRSRMYEESVAKQQTMEFNSQFEQYLGHDITAQEVVTIVNLVKEWNKNNETDKLDITFTPNSLKTEIEASIEKFLTAHVITNKHKFKLEIKTKDGFTNGYDEWGRVRALFISIK